MLLIGLGLVLFTCAGRAIEPLPPAERLVPVPLAEVRLTDDFWLPKIETIQHKTIAFALAKCEAEGRLDNFLIAGGKLPGPVRGAMPFDDTDVYKIIEGASSSLISAPNPELETRLDELIAIIAVGQEADGYLTTWRTIDGLHPPAPWVKPGKRWEYLNMSHELYNAGHLFEAAAVHHAATGKDNLLAIALRYADLLVETFGPGQREAVPGHQIVETGLIKLYRITGRRDYLELAKYFLDHRGDPANHPLYGAYSQDHIPVVDQREVVGHAVRAVYMYAGMTDIADLYQDDAYFTAVDALWHNMVDRKLYLTGGLGAKHDGEAFGADYELPNLTAYAETCAAIGSVMWNQRLYLLTGDKAYYDLIERTLYNGLIAGLAHDGTHFFYSNCLAADKEFAFNRGNHTRSEWFDCSCCPTNLIRFLPTLPGLVYAQQPGAVAVNLYVSNETRLTVAETAVRLTQETTYPWAGDVALTVAPETPLAFALKLRVPGWTLGEPTPGTLYHYVSGETRTLEVTLNGQAQEATITGGYVVVDRRWAAGDTVRLTLPMPIRQVAAAPEVEDLRGQTALERGPLVYCFEEPDNPVAIADITVRPGAGFSSAPMDLIGGIMALHGTDAAGRALTAIPYYAWSNRGGTAMKVWVPTAGSAAAAEAAPH